jgi:UDP-glucose 4-epimerase
VSRILVTGGAGSFGSSLVIRLLKSDHNITIVDIVGPYQSASLRNLHINSKINYLWKSVHDLKSDEIEGHEAILHFAAEPNVPVGFKSHRWTIYENVMGTVSMLDACVDRKLQKVILAGSGNVWGRARYLPIDEKHPLTPHNPYAFSKAAGELAFWAWYHAYNVPVVILSNGIVAGPNMRKDIFIYRWLKNIMQGKPIFLEGGDQTRDLTYVDDALDAWERVIDAPPDIVVGQKFQISYGQEVTVKDLLEMCFEVTGKRVKIIARPYRPGEQGQREQFSIAKAKKVLQFEPKTGPKECIRRTFEWMKTLSSREL